MLAFLCHYGYKLEESNLVKSNKPHRQLAGQVRIQFESSKKFVLVCLKLEMLLHHCFTGRRAGLSSGCWNPLSICQNKLSLPGSLILHGDQTL